MSEECFTFKRIFDEKHEASKILFQEEAFNINDLSFPNDGDKGKGHKMIESHRKKEIKNDEQQTPKGEPNLDRMAQ